MSNEFNSQSRKRLSKWTLTTATWNVRSLVERAGGDQRICRSRPQQTTGEGIVDRKVDLMAKELRRYGVSVAAIQETKWFGSDVWEAQGYLFLHSGRPLPKEGEVAARNEGVGIALDERATKAWKEAGEVWRAVSSRIVVARLKVSSAGQRKPGGSRGTRNTYITVISAYAPTAKAPPAVTQKFMDDLQDVMNTVPAADLLILLGDFNSRVGSSRGDSDLWRDIRGKYGVGECNVAGEKFLEFCALNQLTIMNTWFQKRHHHLTTWKHPATKQWHMIDYVVMRTGQRAYCTDVQVMRGANCWSDHCMIRARLRLCLPHRKRKGADWLPIAAHTLQHKEIREAYQEKVTEYLVSRPHNPNDSIEHNWEVFKECIVAAGEETARRGRSKKHPDWFVEASDTLQPLIDAKNAALNQFLQKQSVSAKKEFRRCQRTVQSAIDDAKEQWINKVADEAEKARKDGHQRWACVRKLQMTHRGRRPQRPSVLLKESGETTANTDEIRKQWQQHFNEILNIPSEYDQEVIDRLPQHTPHLELDEPPTLDELLEALSKLKRGKACGKTGIPPELLVYGSAEVHVRLLQIMKDVWRAGTVVSDWKDAIIVPIPKKGDLRKCSNWRGISLLDVAGKVFARIVQERIQVIAEEILPDSQCGFRKGRGCTDMIFVARQLVEKCREHDDTLFVLFVDLRKAYDSVPRPALWQVLEKYGIPPNMLSIIRSFHDGMQAEIRVGDTTTDKIKVLNGLRQGCTLAPSLFNLYFNAMMSAWRAKCPEAGVTIRYKHGRKLVGDRTAKSRLECVKVTESQFADDAAVYAPSRDAFERATAKLIDTASSWGLTVSMEKTKGMAVGNHTDDSNTLLMQVPGGQIDMVNDFTYLGSTITRDGEVNQDVKLRIGKAARAFGCLQKAVFQNKRFSVETKRRVYKAAVMSVLLYGSETWAIKAESVRRLTSFHNRCIRSMMGVTKHQQWRERITSRRLAAAFGMEETMPNLLTKQRLRWLGHVARMKPSRLPKQLLFGELEKKRPSHGTKRRWRDIAVTDIKAVGNDDSWYDYAQDRQAWEALCRDGLLSLTEQHSHCPFGLPTTDRPTSYPCQCGRLFRRKGDRTRHQRFCDRES